MNKDEMVRSGCRNHFEPLSGVGETKGSGAFVLRLQRRNLYGLSARRETVVEW